MDRTVSRSCDPATCGCFEAITNLKKSDAEQWAKMEKQGEKQDKIYNRINVILGGLCVALLMLVINMAVK